MPQELLLPGTERARLQRKHICSVSLFLGIEEERDVVRDLYISVFFIFLPLFSILRTSTYGAFPVPQRHHAESGRVVASWPW